MEEVGRVSERSRFIKTCSNSARESALCAALLERGPNWEWHSSVTESGTPLGTSWSKDATLPERLQRSQKSNLDAIDMGPGSGDDAVDGTDSSSESIQAQPSKPNSAKTRARQLKQPPARARRRLHTRARRAHFWRLGWCGREHGSSIRPRPAPKSGVVLPRRRAVRGWRRSVRGSPRRLPEVQQDRREIPPEMLAGPKSMEKADTKSLVTCDGSRGVGGDLLAVDREWRCSFN